MFIDFSMGRFLRVISPVVRGFPFCQCCGGSAVAAFSLKASPYHLHMGVAPPPAKEEVVSVQGWSVNSQTTLVATWPTDHFHQHVNGA